MLPLFGQPFVKRFALCYQTVVCLSCLSVLSICDVRALWPNGWTDQDATWYGGRPQPRRLCVRWDPAPSQLRGGAPSSPIFGTCLMWPNGWMDQGGTWRGGVPWSRPHCARWGPSSSPQKWDRAPPSFRPIFVVAKRLYVSGYDLVRR